MDRRSRELERRARAGDPDAEAALLQARVRGGDLAEAGLLLAAYLGHEPAARAANRRPPQSDTQWLERLSSFGDHVVAHACLAGARDVWRAWQAEDHRVFDVALRFLGGPTPALAKVLRRERDRLEPDDLMFHYEAAEAHRRETVVLALGAVLEAGRGAPLASGEATRIFSRGRAGGRRTIERELLPVVLGPDAAALRVAPAIIAERAFVDPRDEARLLRRDVVRGDLAEERLKVAAFLGDEAARLALGPRAPLAQPGEPRPWVQALRTLDPEGLAAGLRAQLGTDDLERAIAVARERGLTLQALRAVLGASVLASVLATFPRGRKAQAARGSGWKGDASTGQRLEIATLKQKAELTDAQLAALLDRLACKDGVDELDGHEAAAVLLELRRTCVDVLARRLKLGRAALDRLRRDEGWPQVDEGALVARVLKRLEKLAKESGLADTSRVVGASQVAFIATLRERAGVDERAFGRLLAKQGAEVPEALTQDGASKLIAALQRRERKRR